MNVGRWTLLMAAVVLPSFSGCHRTQAVQRGYRGQDSVQLFSERTLTKLDAINKYPKPLRQANTKPPTPMRATEAGAGVAMVTSSGVTVIAPGRRVVFTDPHAPLLYSRWSNV